MSMVKQTFLDQRDFTFRNERLSIGKYNNMSCHHVEQYGKYCLIQCHKENAEAVYLGFARFPTNVTKNLGMSIVFSPFMIVNL